MNFKREATFMAYLFGVPLMLSFLSSTLLGQNQGEVFLMIMFACLLIMIPKIRSKARTLVPIEWGPSKMNKSERRMYYSGYTLLIFLTVSLVLVTRN